ncbi:hypothetical protein CO045_03175 [Candidatus Peregrinibacteria bacterium CG_4_9_14_0_2_um_filter_41_14]|nr:MAG: hypothetical protein COY06_06080 [Candidatus Peregrinibacteria bacterium CG_4_10_14_0_2_um_filter_41_8]PJC37919.1 MAG: hypothetical protein CO045_03175 [Candidatus Peregrinibacteria bacterium CG_4_9_14_0_2_um_filter_41_14]
MKFGLRSLLLTMATVLTLFAGNLYMVPQTNAFFDLATDQYTQFLPGTTGSTLQERAGNLLSRATNIVRLVIAPIAILIMLTGSIRMVMARGDEEAYKKGTRTLVYGTAGIAIVALSGDLAQLLSPESGGLLGSDAVLRERGLIFDNTLRIVLTFVKYVAGTVAVAMLVRIGFRLVAFSASDDELAEDKKNMGLIAAGLVVLIFSDTLIRKVLYKVDSPVDGAVSADLPQAMKELVGFINLIVTFVGPIALITLVAGGVMYAASGVNEELQAKAKKMIGVSLGGIILIYGAFAIVNTFIVGRF